jgi:hypothetical protein
MKLSLEESLIDVWRQSLVENAKTVELGKERFPVRRTPKRGLRQVDFVFDGNEIRGLEQNPQTKSRWAQMARSGKEVMQFLGEGRLQCSRKYTHPGVISPCVKCVVLERLQERDKVVLVLV